MTIRVMLVDDHKILREALRTVLNRVPDIHVVAEAGDDQEALRLVQEAAPHLVLMDISMPGLGGAECTRQLLARYPAVKVLALSSHVERHFVLQMLEAGASGYVVKSAGSEELIQGIRTVARGDTYLCQVIAAIVVDSMRSKDVTGKGGSAALGRREREVLQLLAEGKSSPEIAARLFIATSTVEVHRRNIMRKLDLHSVAELTKYAIRIGLTSA